MRSGPRRMGWRLGSPRVRGGRGRGCPVFGHPALHLFRGPREAGGAQLTPESQRVLAALRKPSLQMGEIRIQDAGPERPRFGHGEALGSSVLAHGPDREGHRPANRSPPPTRGGPPPALLIEGHPPLPPPNPGRCLGSGARKGFGPAPCLYIGGGSGAWGETPRPRLGPRR